MSYLIKHFTRELKLRQHPIWTQSADSLHLWMSKIENTNGILESIFFMFMPPFHTQPNECFHVVSSPHIHAAFICIQPRLVAHPCSVTSCVNINCVILWGVLIRCSLFKNTARCVPMIYALRPRLPSVCVLSVISTRGRTNGPLAGGWMKTDLLWNVLKRCLVAMGRMTDLQLWIWSAQTHKHTQTHTRCVYMYTKQFVFVHVWSSMYVLL